MPTTIADFHSLVAGSCNAGSSLDGVIPGRVRMAARFLERNLDFAYMRRWGELNIDADADEPHVVSLFGYNFKAIDAVRIVNLDVTPGSDDADRFTDLKLIDPRQRTTRRSESPSAYWLDGVTNLILDARPNVDMVLELHYRAFTEWSASSGWTHWLLQNAEDLLLAQSMMFIAIYRRDMALYATYKAMRDDSMKTLQAAEEELAFSNREAAMLWLPPGGDELLDTEGSGDPRFF